VIDAASGDLDFYIVHDYGFNDSASPDDVLARPTEAWPGIVRDVTAALAAAEPAAPAPVAVTEYNMFAFADGDTRALMSKAINMLYIADTIGQLATQGVTMANQWDLINGPSASGSDYGVLDSATSAPLPQFFALALWSRFGTDLLPIELGFDARSRVSAYAARSADGSVTAIVINKTARPVDATIDLSGAAAEFEISRDVASAAALDATTVSFNGQPGNDTDLTRPPRTSLGLSSGRKMAVTLDPSSVTLLTMRPRP
jgi:hypothetical protein